MSPAVRLRYDVIFCSLMKGHVPRGSLGKGGNIFVLKVIGVVFGARLTGFALVREEYYGDKYAKCIGWLKECEVDRLLSMEKLCFDRANSVLT